MGGKKKKKKKKKNKKRVGALDSSILSGKATPPLKVIDEGSDIMEEEKVT